MWTGGLVVPLGDGVALFVDHENVVVSLNQLRLTPGANRLARAFRTQAARHGRLLVAQAFANWTHFDGQEAYSRQGVEPVFSMDGDNRADVRMASAALQANLNPAVRAIILVTGDADFLPVVTAIRQTGRIVHVWAVSSSASAALKGVADGCRSVEEVLSTERETGRGIGGGQPPALAEAPGAKLKRLSVSQLKAYENCPRQWYLRCIRNLPTPPSPEGFVGQMVHHALRDFMLLAPGQRKPEYLHELLREHWRNDPKGRKGFADPGHEASFGRRAMELLDNFYAGSDLGVVPKEVEKFLDWPWPFPVAAGDGSGNGDSGGRSSLIMAGKIDRIDERPDGTVEIVDYKTGHVPPSDEYARRDLQVGLYWCMVQEVLGYRVASFKLLGLAEYRELAVELSPEDVQTHLHRAADVVARIRTDTNPQPRVSALCPWCGYLADCPEREAAEEYTKDRASAELPF